MAVLAEPNGRGVAVPADAEHHQVAVGELGSGGERRHPAMRTVEAVGVLHEVGGGLGGAADPAHLGQQMGFDGAVVERLDDVVGDRVVPAACAEGGVRALVVISVEPQAVQLLDGDFHGPPLSRPARAGS